MKTIVLGRKAGSRDIGLWCCWYELAIAGLGWAQVAMFADGIFHAIQWNKET